MAEQYRAQWKYSQGDTTQRVASATAEWIRDKYSQELPDDGQPYTRTFKAQGTECFTMLDVVEGSDGEGQTVSFRLTETKQDGEFWSTEIIAATPADGNEADYYCSVSTEQVQSARPISIAAPRVVTTLLVDATLANWPLDPRSMRIDDDIAGLYASELASRDRSIPFVVLRPADESATELEAVTLTADSIARRLAGLCAVQVINSGVEAKLSERFAAGGYFVPAGHVRIFHPSINGDDLATRSNPMRRLRSSQVLIEWVTMQVAPRSVVRQPPPSIARYLRSDRALRSISGSAADSSERATALAKENKHLDSTIRDLERRNGSLIESISFQELEYADLQEEYKQLDADGARRQTLMRSLESALGFALSASPNLEEGLREKGLWPWPDEGSTQGETGESDVATISEEWSPDTSADCFEYAHELLGQWLSIPEGAGRDLEALDASPNASVWAMKAWRAFVALAAYSEAKVADKESEIAGFWEWCASGAPLHWPATKKALAMKESEGTMNNRRFAETRDFPTEEGGTMVMEAHMKIAEGGGETIPRLYFAYDDALGKVRIGFFGPHRLVPNPSAS